MNAVSVIATLTQEPELRTTRTGEPECRMHLAVPRYSPAGVREPGVVFIEASTFGLRAQEHAEQLTKGSRVGLSGRLDGEPGSAGLHIDQLDLL